MLGIVAVSWTKDLDLSDMSVSTRLLVLEYTNLNVHRFNSGPDPVVQREDIPSKRLDEFDHFDLLQFVEAVSHPDGDLLGCVTLISLEVEIESDLTHPGLL